MSTYEIGARGDGVRRIQEALWACGFSPGTIDGIFGSGTRKAVLDFQRASGLNADGRVGEETLAKLFPNEAPQLDQSITGDLNRRCLTLTGAFETSSLPPECFAGLTGDFDGQGISFGALQFNFGQGSLEPLLKEMIAHHKQLMQDIFDERLADLSEVLNDTHAERMAFARAIQDSRKRVVEPWRSMFKAMGRTEECIALQVNRAESTFERGLATARDMGLKSKRAAALMFDIMTQNGSLKAARRQSAREQFARLPSALDATDREIEMMRIIARVIAAAAKPTFQSDVLSRKLTCAEGVGTVHGTRYNLDDFGLDLSDFAAA